MFYRRLEGVAFILKCVGPEGGRGEEKEKEGKKRGLWNPVKSECWDPNVSLTQVTDGDNDRSRGCPKAAPSCMDRCVSIYSHTYWTTQHTIQITTKCWIKQYFQIHAVKKVKKISKGHMPTEAGIQRGEK